MKCLSPEEDRFAGLHAIYRFPPCPRPDVTAVSRLFFKSEICRDLPCLVYYSCLAGVLRIRPIRALLQFKNPVRDVFLCNCRSSKARDFDEYCNLGNIWKINQSVLLVVVSDVLVQIIKSSHTRTNRVSSTRNYRNYRRHINTSPTLELVIHV